MLRLAAVFLAGVLTTILVLSLSPLNSDRTVEQSASIESAGVNTPAYASATRGSVERRTIVGGDAVGSPEDGNSPERGTQPPDQNQLIVAPIENSPISEEFSEDTARSNESFTSDSSDRSDASIEGDFSSASRIVVPETHSPLVSLGGMSDALTELQEEERDEAWASFAESLVYTHVATHPNGREIALAQVICRQVQCWILGTAYGENASQNWEQVKSDLAKQSWFATYFMGFAGESSATLPEGLRFVTMYYRAGFEPESPFAQ